MENCIFCKIVRGEILNYTVFEDEKVLAFLDITPCTKGHTVVVLKEHGESLQEYEEKNLEGLFPAIQKVVRKLEEKLGVKDFTIGMNNGRLAGQLVPHMHVHIIPRYEGDTGGNIHSIVKKESDTSVADIAKLL
ncbi:MAG: HIT family protein [Candidatus Magasanikbacteria bacterium]